MAPSMLVGDFRLKELEHGLIQGITTAKNTLSYKIPCRAHQVTSGITQQKSPRQLLCHAGHRQ